MSVMSANLYKALVTAKVPEEMAQKAAEEVAGYDDKLAKVQADLGVLKWMTGFALALQVTLLFKLFH